MNPISPSQQWRLLLLDFPLVVREVRTRMRGTRSFVIVFVYDLLLICFMALIYLEQTRQSRWMYGNIELGRSIFVWVSYAQMALLLLVAPAITSGSITSERERRSLDVMATSLLTPREIVWGKLLASTSFSVVLLISSVPLIGICFMFGGIGPVELCKTMALLLASILSFSAMALFFSAVSKRTVVSVVLTFVGVLAFTIGIPLLLFLVGEIVDWSNRSTFSASTLISTPFAMMTVLSNEFSGMVLRERIWAIHIGVHACLTVLWLTFAARFVTYPRVRE